MSLVVEAEGLAAASGLLSETYWSMSVDARGQQGGMRLDRASLGPVQLDHVRFAMDFDIVADPPDALVFGHLVDGQLSYGSADGPRAFSPGQVFHNAAEPPTSPPPAASPSARSSSPSGST